MISASYNFEIALTLTNCASWYKKIKHNIEKRVRGESDALTASTEDKSDSDETKNKGSTARSRDRAEASAWNIAAVNMPQDQLLASFGALLEVNLFLDTIVIMYNTLWIELGASWKM